MTKDKERDDALIEKKRLAGLFEDRTCYIPAEDYLRAATFLRDEQPKPVDDEAIPMLLHCPLCSLKHIDEGLFATKPHHTHACQGCGHVWRPAKVNTCGVQFLPGYKNAERGDEPAKPDRYLQVWKEAKAAYIRPNRTEHESDQAAAAVLRRHFDELRAEIEAEHLEFCETHERLNRVQRDHIRKLETERRIEPATNGEPDRWTLAMRECLQVSALECNKADAIAGKFDNESYVLDQVAALRKHFPEGPAVVVPMSAKMWAESVLNLRGAINATCEREAARFILSLDGAGYEYADV